MQPAQPNPQSPLNYAAMLITREYMLKESQPPLGTTALPTLQSSILVISTGEAGIMRILDREVEGRMPRLQ